MSRQCTRVGAVVSSSSNPGIPARIEGFCFEYFRNAPDVPCKVIDLELPEGKGLEEVTDDILEEAVEKKAEELGNFDGIFSVEDRLTALLYRVWNKKDMKIPETVSCNRMPEYLAGLYPRPASIDMSASTGAELGVGELLRRISGGKVKSDNVAVIATPQLVPGDF
jgi:DNA-binding LacI/PurR family transcriptional regulator